METTSASTSKIISRNFEDIAIEKTDKPDRLKARILRVSMLFILAIILVLNNALYTLYIPLVTREYKIVYNNNMLYYYALMYASKDIAVLIASPLIGGLIDRVGYDDPLIGGIGFILVSTIIFAFGDSYWLFYTNRVFQGLTSILTDTSIMVVIATLFTRDETRLYAFGALLGCSSLLLLTVSPFVDILMTNLLDNRILFLGFDAAYVGISLIAFCLLKWYNFAQFNADQKTKTKEDLVPMWNLLIDPYILICAGSLAVSQILPSFFQYVLPFWPGGLLALLNNGTLSSILGLSAHIAGIITAVMVGKNYRNRRWLIIAAGLTLEGICGLVLPFVTSYIPLVISMCGISFGIALVRVIALPTLARLADARHTSIYGSIFAISYLFYAIVDIIAPITLYNLITYTTLTLTFVAIALTNILYAPILFFLRWMY